MERRRIWVAVLLAVAVLAGCGAPAPTERATEQAGPAATAGPAPTVAATAGTAPPMAGATAQADEAQVRAVVEGFGKRLQAVSLLAPNAGQQIVTQYGEFVAPSLLETWLGNVSQAPGRVVSSPWPDRIEIAGLAQEAPDRYVVTGQVVEVTSAEALSGGAAARTRVRLVVARVEGRWLITEWVLPFQGP